MEELVGLILMVILREEQTVVTVLFQDQELQQSHLLVVVEVAVHLALQEPQVIMADQEEVLVTLTHLILLEVEHLIKVMVVVHQLQVVTITTNKVAVEVVLVQLD
jgi:hypothetical protein